MKFNCFFKFYLFHSNDLKCKQSYVFKRFFNLSININTKYKKLSAISISFEMKPQLKYIIMKLTSESSFVAKFPLAINNFER